MKKLLALVLALVMSMSLVTISNAAFSDADTIDNTEAVEVMAAVGVLKGYDGKFDPKAELTRAQACKIVAYLDLGEKTADAIKGTGAIFTDVPASNWAAGYIEYCAGAGYVAGIGDKKFAPDEKVTGVQFAKMLLCALGYKADVEGYTGADYTINIARDANANSLYDDLSVSAASVLTREQAAQMAFNALEATVVKYTGGTTVDTSDGTKVTVNAERYNDSYAKNDDYRTVAADRDGDKQLVEKLYGTDLKLNAGGTDDFGRPADRWTYKGVEVGTYAQTATLTYTGEVKAKDMYRDLGNPDLKNYDFEAYMNGSVYSFDGDTMYEKAMLTGKTSDKGASHDGVVTEVYFDTDAEKLTVVSYAYFLAQATEDYDAKDEDITIDLLSNKSLSDTKLDADDFAIQNLKEDDYIVVTLAAVDNTKTSKFEVKTIAPATVIENVQVSVARSDDYVTAAGTKYTYADLAAKKDTDSLGYDLMHGSSAYSLNDKTYNLYLDPNGYVLGVEGYASSADITQYVFVDDINTSGFDDSVKLIFTDGTKKTVTLNEVNGYAKNDKGYKAPVKGTFYEFTAKSDGTYDLDKISDDKVSQGHADGLLEDTVKPMYKAAGLSYVANNDTVYLTKSTVYTGVKNAPKVSAADNVNYFLVKDNAILFVYATKNGSATTDVDSYVYILSDNAATAKDGDDTYYVYTAIVNGEKTTLNANQKNKAEGLYKVETYTDGRADLDDALTGLKGSGDLDEYAKLTGVKGTTKVSKGVLTVNGSTAYSVDSSCTILSVDGTTVETVSQSGVKSTVEDGFTTIYVVFKSNSDDTVVTMYLVK